MPAQRMAYLKTAWCAWTNPGPLRWPLNADTPATKHLKNGNMEQNILHGKHYVEMICIGFLENKY
jgi:hypothetical protein